MELYSAIERECPDAILHCGDYYEDVCELQQAYPDLQIDGVLGNNDWGVSSLQHQTIVHEEIPIYLTHGHREGVSAYSPGRVAQAAQTQGCKLAFFGHTHRPFCGQIDSVLVINPGSISLPRSSPASYCRVILENGTIRSVTFLDTEGFPFEPIEL